ncbi:MAG TPA: DinB family protein [Gemmatimonadaceae bacterium]|jgi:hypothetical protein
MNRKVEKLIEQNRSAAADFAAAARAIPEGAWTSPIASGKWSPAQHVEHVGRAYGAAVLDIVNDQPMRLIGTPRQRRWWRLIGLNMVRLFGRLPHGAPAPREIRPVERSTHDRSALLNELDEHVRSFENAVGGANEQRGFMHPYFGALTLADGVRLIATHTRHHERALRAALAHSAGQ